MILAKVGRAKSSSSLASDFRLTSESESSRNLAILYHLRMRNVGVFQNGGVAASCS